MIKVQNFYQVNRVSCPLSIAIKCMQAHVATNSAKANLAHPAFYPAKEICSLISATALQATLAGWLAKGFTCGG